MDFFDCIVCGAGPAGSAFSMTAPEDMKILLLDGGARPKPCGGLLAPDAQKALARFELTLPKDILVDPQIFFRANNRYENKIGSQISANVYKC